MSKPYIGIGLDYEEKGSYSDKPSYRLRTDYSSAIEQAGGLPFLLPYDHDNVEDYLSVLDGILIPGSDFDINPERFDAVKHPETTEPLDIRDEHQLQLIALTQEKHIPFFGICSGIQFLNVALGGTLVQHIPEEVETEISHQFKQREKAAHDVHIVENTRLHSITNSTSLAVNSSHHQSIDTLAPALVVSATAPDGIIEGVEDPNHPFCLAVQWHPELPVNHADQKLFEVFVEAAQQAQTQHKKKQPLVGILLDYEEKGSFSTLPSYSIEAIYSEVVTRHQALPLYLPLTERSQELFKALDGLIIPNIEYDAPISVEEFMMEALEQKIPTFVEDQRAFQVQHEMLYHADNVHFSETQRVTTLFFEAVSSKVVQRGL